MDYSLIPQSGNSFLWMDYKIREKQNQEEIRSDLESQSPEKVSWAVRIIRQ
jgi:hypothetical protein